MIVCTRRIVSAAHKATRRFATKLDSGLAGTAPRHNLYVFLHSPTPPASFPQLITSDVQRALLFKLTPFRGLVNFSWSPNQNMPSHASSNDGHEIYSATAFPSPGQRIDIDQLSLSNLDHVVEQLTTKSVPAETDITHIYVCTHGARDCRCGETGGQVAKALRHELDRRKLSSRIRLAETAHVGGHKYAANVLVYPHGEWLGYVKPQDVPFILDTIIDLPRDSWRADERAPLCPSHWRGRMGLDKEQQIHLYNKTTSPEP